MVRQEREEVNVRRGEELGRYQSGRTLRPNECWCVELLRCKIRDIVTIAAIFDLASRLPIRVDITSSSAHDLTIRLEEAAAIAGYPETVWMDSSFEFISPELREWAERTGVGLIWGGELAKESLRNRLWSAF
jgi:hypothetical protein